MKRFILLLIIFDIVVITLSAYNWIIYTAILFWVILFWNILQLYIQIQLDDLEKKLR